jgi:hypothetical protein
MKRTRETALGFLAANIAVPGFGTFLAGRRFPGVVQMLVALGGMGVSVVFGLKMAVWMLGNWEQLHDPYADPAESLRAIWGVSKWPLAGIASFAFAWVWAVMGSLRLVRSDGAGARRPD